MLLKITASVKLILLFTHLFLITCFTGCSKESTNTFHVGYQLEASANTADHFYVTYLNEHAETVVEHQHTGWKYSFSATRPFEASLEAKVNPIDKYTFTVKILIDGQVVQQDSASTASGAIQTIHLAHTAN